MTDQATLTANTLSGTNPEEDRLHRLERLAEHQSRQIGALTKRLEQEKNSQSAWPEHQATSAVRERDRERELPYRFDAGPKWLQESGWREQSTAHRKAWPVLWRILELEWWPGSPVRITHDQLADHLGVSPDTAKRRLRWLKDEGVLEIMPGSGRRPSTVAVQHPIQTPIPYAEVPWPAGGMAGAPGGYLKELAGPKRYYAELYGVELPEPEPGPVPGEGKAPYQEECPPPEEPEGPLEEPCGERSGEGVQAARAGGAMCPPSEMRESNVIPNFFSPRDEGTRARNPEKEKKEETPNTNQKKPLISQTEQQIRAIPSQEVDNEAASTARKLVDALGAHDAATATRAGQLAALALRQGEGNHLQEVCRRIRNRNRKVRIAVPTRYAISVLLQVRKEAALTEEETEVGQRVLAREPTDVPPDGGDSKGSERAKGERGGSFSEGYEWFFGEGSPPPDNETTDNKTRTDFKEGYEWFFE